MAKRQNFVVGSGNPVTVTKTPEQLNVAWNQLEVLRAGDLDGVLKATSYYSNDSSNEIANAIERLTGTAPAGATQEELADAIQHALEEIQTTSLTFKGYVSTTEPSSTDFNLKIGNIWINSASMPTVFPVAIAGRWNGSEWETTTDTYTATDFDFFRDVDDNEGYYWFGGVWKIMSTDMSTTYFSLDASGKWQINPTYDATLVHKSGNETITGQKTFDASPTMHKNLTPSTADTKESLVEDTLINTSMNTNNQYDGMGIVRAQRTDGSREVWYRAGFRNSTDTGTLWPAIEVGVAADDTTYISTNTSDLPTSENSKKIPTTKWVNNKLAGYEPLGGGAPTGTVTAFAGSTAPTGWLICNGGAISRTTYSNLFAVIGTTYGAGDGSTTFNIPNLTGNKIPLGVSGDIGASTNGALPNITANSTLPGPYGNLNPTGAFYFGGNTSRSNSSWSNDWYNTLAFKASNSSSLYKDNQTTVVPAGVQMRYLIKY